MTRDLHMNRPTPVSRGQGQEEETSLNKSDTPGDFPGGSVIKASCCQCRGVGSIGELRTHMPWGTAKRFFFKVILQDILQNTDSIPIKPGALWLLPFHCLQPSLLHSGAPTPSPREPDWPLTGGFPKHFSKTCFLTNLFLMDTMLENWIFIYILLQFDYLQQKLYCYELCQDQNFFYTDKK